MKIITSLLLVFFTGYVVYFQQVSDTTSLAEKFDQIYRTSSSYKEFKVIRKTRFLQLKKWVSDSLNQLKKEVNAKNEFIASQSDSIQSIKEIVETIEGDFRQTLAQKNNIRFLGITFLKSTYNTIIWLLITTLIILLCYFAYRFRSNNLTTTSAKAELLELEEEYATHRKKSLDREQKLRRKLQDEINKQRGI